MTEWFATAPQDDLRYGQGAMLSIHQVPTTDPERGCTIAKVYGDTKEECWERGTLIAAAGEMYDALKDLECDQLHSILASQFGDERAASLTNAIRRAIGKAQGEK